MIIFILLGFVSSIFQLTLLREFTFSIAKNELSLIIAIGIWITSSSLASFVRTKKSLISNLGLAVLLSLGFGACVFLAHGIKSLFAFTYYESVSVVFALGAGLLVMAPIGFLTGYAFSQFNSDAISKEADTTNHLSHPFAYEALGILIGGILFTFILSRYDNPLTFCSLPLLLIPVITANPKQKLLTAVLLMALSFSFSNNYIPLIKQEFQNARIVARQGSVAGPLLATEKNNARSLFLNGALVATSEDKETQEAFIHTLFSTKEKINTVLWIGPCFSSQLREIEKYQIESITCVDLNPRPKDLPSFYASSQNVHFLNEDPRRFLEKNKNTYDLIIMNIPAPSALGLNRLFTLEFFKAIKNRLSPEGIFAFSIPSKRDILSPSIQSFNSCIINTTRQVFANILIIPSDTMMLIASSHPITAQDVIKNFENNNRKARFFTSFHLKDSLDKEKQNYVLHMIDASIPINTDLRPYGFVYYLLLEQTKFFPHLSSSLPLKPFKKYILVGFLFALTTIGFFFYKQKGASLALNAGIFGFLSIGTSALIYFLFQLISGTLFWKLGMIVGLFMGGVGLGVLLPEVILKKKEITSKHLGWLFLLWFGLCLEMFCWANLRWSGLIGEMIWGSLSFECGILTGAGYTFLSRLWQKETNTQPTSIAPLIYASDLAGAALGTFLFSLFFIPFLGINLCFLILISVVFVAGLKTCA